MKAIILAAGKGTRLSSLTKDKPKCLLEFLGKSLLDRQIEIFKDLGIADIIVVTGYLSDKIQHPDCIKIKNENYGTTNMVESLFCTRSYWTDTIVVSYGDIIYEKRVFKKLIDSKEDLNVVVDLNGASYFKERFGRDFLLKTESLIFGDDGSIVDIGGPNPDIFQVQGQYIGLMKFTKKGHRILSKVYDEDRKNYWGKPWIRSKNFQNGYMTDMLQRIIDKGYKVNAIRIRGGWLEFDTVIDYKKYQQLYNNNRLSQFYDPNA